MTWPSRPSRELVRSSSFSSPKTCEPQPGCLRIGPIPDSRVLTMLIRNARPDAKANKEMADKAKGKGPMNAGQQGIKKSGKK